MPYWMGILTPNDDGQFRIYWSWDPHSDLLACRRSVSWEQASGSVPLDEHSWDVQDLEASRSWRRMHHRFAVRIDEADLARLQEDDFELTRVRGRI